MRKRAPRLPLSPKLLKQFAIATVIITGLVAMFANGETAQLQAEVQAREAKNQLLATEADKLGARKVAMGMVVKVKPVDWDGDAGEALESTGGEGSIDPDAPRAVPSFTQSGGIRPPRSMLPPSMPPVPGQTVSVKGQLATDLAGPFGDAARAREKGKAGTMFRPNAQQIEQIKATSRERTGGSAEIE